MKIKLNLKKIFGSLPIFSVHRLHGQLVYSVRHISAFLYLYATFRHILQISQLLTCSLCGGHPDLPLSLLTSQSQERKSQNSDTYGDIGDEQAVDFNENHAVDFVDDLALDFIDDPALDFDDHRDCDDDLGHSYGVLPLQIWRKLPSPLVPGCHVHDHEDGCVEVLHRHIMMAVMC